MPGSTWSTYRSYMPGSTWSGEPPQILTPAVYHVPCPTTMCHDHMPCPMTTCHDHVPCDSCAGHQRGGASRAVPTVSLYTAGIRDIEGDSSSTKKYRPFIHTPAHTYSHAPASAPGAPPPSQTAFLKIIFKHRRGSSTASTPKRITRNSTSHSHLLHNSSHRGSHPTTAAAQASCTKAPPSPNGQPYIPAGQQPHMRVLCLLNAQNASLVNWLDSYAGDMCCMQCQGLPLP